MNTVFIFDEAQLTYVDGDLWSRFFKSMRDHKNRRAIIFTSFGSPSSRITIAGFPIHLSDHQRVTLRAVQHDDNLPPVGLFFTRTEFNDLVSLRYPSANYPFHTSFLDRIFDITNGHVGAIVDFIGTILAHDVSPLSPILVMI